MQTPYDEFDKGLLREALSVLGEVESGKEIMPERLEADVAFIPSLELDEREVIQRGLLGRMSAQGPCLFEPFSTLPRFEDFTSILQKLWAHQLEEDEYEGDTPPELRLS